MQILKFVRKAFFWLLVLALLATPIYLVFQLSEQEMAEYETPLPPVILDSAYGDIKYAYRGDLAEFTSVSGKYVCNEYAYMELEYRDCNLIRWEVSVGDLITEGQKLGSYRGEDVLAAMTGVISEMQTYGEDCYLQLQLLTPVELECNVTDEVLKTLQKTDTLTLRDGTEVTITYQSPMKNEDGQTTIRLRIDGAAETYGTVVNDLDIYTGRTYSNVLLLDVDCIYPKGTGDETVWYVREVTENGVFIQEHAVELGYSDGQVICVSGVDEGMAFDSGYAEVMEGGS